MSLEVDCRQGGAPIPYQREDEGFMYLNENHAHRDHGQGLQEAQTNEKQLDIQPSKPTRRFYGKNIAVSSRLIVFWSVVFCLVSVLAVVAAGVTGSIAARRGRSLNTCMSTMRNLDTSLNANCSSTANGTSGANQSNSQSAQDSDPESFISTSDCSDLSSPYIPTLTSMGATSSNISFDIKCGTDYNEPSADFMTLAAFTFEDCIAACASFNERLPNLHPNLKCYIASYDLNLREVAGGAWPSCKLKASKNVASSAAPGVAYSALLVEG